MLLSLGSVLSRKQRNSLEIAGGDFEAAQVGQIATDRKEIAMRSWVLVTVLDLLPGKPREANVAAHGTDRECALAFTTWGSLLPDEEGTGIRGFKRVGMLK